MRRKPTRRDLLVVIARLQDMIGAARGDHQSDIDRAAFVRAQETLREAFGLCIDARSFDACMPLTGPWSKD